MSIPIYMRWRARFRPGDDSNATSHWHLTWAWPEPGESPEEAIRR